jgi:predicted TIM-barrel fold metal-dependent hydrolase
VVDGKPLPLRGVATAGALLPDRSVEPRRWGEVPPAAYQPAARLQAMDAADIGYSALYPTVAGAAGETFAQLDDPELELACVQAYNDWLVDEWAAASDRFVPQCIAPLYPPEAAAAEIRRAVGRGHRGVVYPALPMELRAVPHVNEPAYDAIWATCTELGVPLCCHAGSVLRLQLPAHESFSPKLADALRSVTRSAESNFEVANLIFSRILARHASLRVVFAESALGWATYMVEVTEDSYRANRLELDEGYELKPTELINRQCYFTGWYDRVADLAGPIGAGNILWASNFPLANSTWPDCQKFIARSFEGVSDDDRRRILWDNAAELYGLPKSDFAPEG